MKFMNVIKKFENQQDVMNFRDSLLDKAEELLNSGEMEQYKEQMEDVKTFDNEYKEYIEAQANMAALRGTTSMENVISAQGKQDRVDTINAAWKEQDNRGYRMAFMNFVLNGTAIPQEFRNEDAYTVTSDVTAVIPNTILDRIIEKMEVTGTILNKVTRTFYKGGVSVPISAAKPVATWTTERGTTNKQKKEVGSITFTYHKLKCVVSVSLTVETVTLEVFEKTLVNNIAEAMVKALETAIINGTGTGQPKGILAETPLTGQVYELAADITYKDTAKIEGLLPAAYESAEWYMTKRTYFDQFVGMTDDNGQPICRTSVGMEGKPQYRILGRLVNFVSPETMKDFDNGAGSVVAFMFRMEDYMLNTNMNVTVKHYEDNDTDDKVTKAIMLADGKVVDLNSYVAVKRKAS